MTRDELAKVMEGTFHELMALREAGQKEYAHNQDNAFANFERVGSYLQTDRRKILLTYVLKHIDGITAFVNGHESQREDVTGRIHDAIVYLLILKGMIIEDRTPASQTIALGPQHIARR